MAGAGETLWPFGFCNFVVVKRISQMLLTIHISLTLEEIH